MAVLFQVVLYLVHWLEGAFGNRGLLASGAILGFTDVDALTISMARGLETNGLERRGTGALPWASCQHVAEAIVAAALGSGRFRLYTLAGLAGMGIALGTSLSVFEVRCRANVIDNKGSHDQAIDSDSFDNPADHDCGRGHRRSGAGSAGSQIDPPNVTPDRLLKAAAEPQNWLMYSGAYNSHRHSPLTQITTANAKDLSLKWSSSRDLLKRAK